MTDSVCGVGDEYYRFEGIKPDLDRIPISLCHVPQWVLWKAVPKPQGGMNKIPYQPNGAKASSTDPNTWSDFDTAWSAYQEAPDEFGGIGFVLSVDDAFIGGDFDHCRNSVTGDLTPAASRIVEGLDTYWEVSPSGTGIRFIAKGEQVRSFKGNGVEVYTSGRYLTITGERIGDEEEPLEVHRSSLDRLAALAKDRPQREEPTGDEVVAWFVDQELYLRQLQDGRHQVVCPWWEEHTGGDRTGTVYMEAHHNGHAEARFVCQHSHGDKYHLKQVRELMNGEEKEEVWPPARGALVLSEDELHSSKLTPKCFVKNYIYADLAQLVAPGGTGKTTILLHEAVCLALGNPIWGLPVENPGWTLFVTKEDRRERLAARTREIMAAMELSAEERAHVLNSLIILDVTGTTRKLTFVHDGNILWANTAELICNAYVSDPPAVVVFDPLASFGASEAMVNDNEQALVEVARKMVNALGCCVRYVHHTGKINARAAKTDQYSGRGGTALPDGSRMTVVLDPWDGEADLPPGCLSGQDVSIMRLLRHKMSYSKPNLPPIWLRREGFEITGYFEMQITPEDRRQSREEQLLRFLTSRLDQGERHTARTLEAINGELGMPRAALRSALASLEASGRVLEVPLPEELRRGRRQTYLQPAH